MGGFINWITSKDLNLKTFWDLVGDFIKKAGEGDTIIASVSSILLKIGVFLLLALGIVELLYGKKFLNAQKFVFCAIAGYIVGSEAVHGIINKIFEIPPYVCGIAIAILAAVLSKMIYNIALYGGSGFLVYLLFFANGVLPFGLPTEGNQIISLIIALVVVIAMFICRKNIDRILTSFVGSFCITTAVMKLFGKTVDKSWVSFLIIVGLFVFGFIFQRKRRKRYYG